LVDALLLRGYEADFSLFILDDVINPCIQMAIDNFTNNKKDGY
jgi:hypothetical protein